MWMRVDVFRRLFEPCLSTLHHKHMHTQYMHRYPFTGKSVDTR